MIDLINISEKFRISATDALFGNDEASGQTVDANADQEDLVIESFEIADRIQRSHLIAALDRYAANFTGQKPSSPDPELYFKLADNFAILAQKALNASRRNQLILDAGGPSRDISDAFAAKGYKGLAIAFLPEW